MPRSRHPGISFTLSPVIAASNSLRYKLVGVLPIAAIEEVKSDLKVHELKAIAFRNRIPGK